jgi:hypothetical protein
MIIWLKVTPNPFAFGNSERFIGTEIDEETYLESDLGMDFKGYYISVNGRSYVFEKESGGWVGDTLEQVREDIKACGNRNIMEEQVADAIVERERVKLISFAEFFDIGIGKRYSL